MVRRESSKPGSADIRNSSVISAMLSSILAYLKTLSVQDREIAEVQLFRLCLSVTSATFVFLPICTKGGTENFESFAFCEAADGMQYGRAKDYFYLECELY